MLFRSLLASQRGCWTVGRTKRGACVDDRGALGGRSKRHPIQPGLLARAELAGALSQVQYDRQRCSVLVGRCRCSVRSRTAPSAPPSSTARICRATHAPTAFLSDVSLCPVSRTCCLARWMSTTGTGVGLATALRFDLIQQRLDGSTPRLPQSGRFGGPSSRHLGRGKGQGIGTRADAVQPC